MSRLSQKHCMTKDEAKGAMSQFLESEGYDVYVSWDAYEFSAKVAFGLVLNLKGGITDEEIIIEECTGSIADEVLEQFRKLMARMKCIK